MDTTKREETDSLSLASGYSSSTTGGEGSSRLRQRIHTTRRQNVTVFDQTVDKVRGDDSALRMTRHEDDVCSVEVFHPFVVL